MPRPAFAVSYSFSRTFVLSKIETDAHMAIDGVAPIVTLEELYNGFEIDDDTKATLLRADKKTWLRHYNTYQLTLIGFNLKGAKVPVTIKASLPHGYDVLTARSVFAPVFRFAQEWSIFHYVVKEVMPYIGRNAISTTFPWIRDFIQEENYDFTKDAKNKAFYRKWMLGNANDRRTCDTCVRAVFKPPYPNMPLLPNGLREAAALGSKLYTQYRLLKQRPHRPMDDSQFKITPQIDDALVPEYIQKAVEEMKEFQQQLRIGRDPLQNGDDE